jgi:hypothetical protein
MPESRTSLWTSGLVINLTSNVIGLAVGAAVTYFTHQGAGWVNPVLCGGAAWLLTFCLILAFRASRHIPKRAELIDEANIQTRLRDWLDKYNFTVKNTHTEECHFFFIVTTEGERKISISRQKGQLSDYLFVKGLISSSAEEMESIKSFTDDEKRSLRLSMFLEMSRAVMGYKTEKDVLEEITVFKRIPISSKLKLEEIINVVWEIEAMLTTLLLLQSAATFRSKMRTKNETEMP